MGYISQLTDLEEARRSRERVAISRIQGETTTEPTVIPSKPLPAPTQETTAYRRTDKGYKRGHYTKTTTKIKQVINLYSQGQGVRTVATELNLAKNTIRTIIAEQPPYILNLKQAESQRKRRQTEREKGNIIRALTGLVSSAKASGYSLETIFEHAFTILERYLKNYPETTILTLVGTRSFSVDDVIKRVDEITLRQYLRLDDRFEQVDEDTFHLKDYKPLE